MLTFSTSDGGDISVHPPEVRTVLLYHRCPGLIPRSTWAEVSHPRLEAGAERNYPASTTFHARGLSPHCSETKLLFCLFFRWNLRHELQNGCGCDCLCECLSLLRHSQPAQEKRTLSGPRRKREKSVLAQPERGNFSAAEFESLIPPGVIC